MSTGKQTTVIVGTIVASVLLLGGLMLGQFALLSDRIDELRADMNMRFERLETRMDSFDERLRAVETNVARLDASAESSPSN